LRRILGDDQIDDVVTERQVLPVIRLRGDLAVNVSRSNMLSRLLHGIGVYVQAIDQELPVRKEFGRRLPVAAPY